MHRVTGRGYGAQNCPLTSSVVSYAYDSGVNGKGHLASLTDQAGTGSYAYDNLGRMATETRFLIGANSLPVSKTMSYTYNLDSSIKSLTYPSNAVITYAPWNNGMIAVSTQQEAKDVGNGVNYVTGATYGPDIALTGFVSGNSGTFAGISNKFIYTPRLQPCRMAAATGGILPANCADTAHGNILDLGYDFHLGNGLTGTDNGNVYGITNYKDQTRTQTFAYDPLNRVLSAQNTGIDCSVLVLQNKIKFWGNSYLYDAWGNLLQKNITKCGAEHLTVTADAQNRIHSSSPDYQYDAAGNMTSDPTDSVAAFYDAENRISTATQNAVATTYTYDAAGNRVRKSNGNTASSGTLYWDMTPGMIAETDLAGATTSEYVFFGGERVARRDGINGAGGVFYYFSDHLKTASVITDSAGVIKAESDYYPWGGELQFVANDSNHYKFTGKERDSESGLDYFGARYYSNGLGRWVSADWSATPVPVPYADLTDAQSLNLYSYVRNIPTTRFDLDGHAPPPVVRPCAEGICLVHPGCAGNYICSKPAPTNPDGSLAPPRIPLSPGKNGEANSWVRKPSGKGTRVKWGPKVPVKSAKGGQPSASWDEPNEHWDFKPGDGSPTKRFTPDGVEVDHNNNPVNPFRDMPNLGIPSPFPDVKPLPEAAPTLNPCAYAKGANGSEVLVAGGPCDSDPVYGPPPVPGTRMPSPGRAPGRVPFGPRFFPEGELVPI